MTTTEIILTLAGIAMWRASYFIEDLIYDIRRKIRNRGK